MERGRGDEDRGHGGIPPVGARRPVPCRRVHGAWWLVGVLLAGIAGSLPAATAAWDPATIAGQGTLRLRTVGPQEGEYWFPVWFVVIDGEVYVRLGTRATGRVQRNTTAPYLGVELGGHRYDRVRGVPAPEYAARVAKAMADKYWADLLVRWLSHPLTLRLVPDH